MACLSNLAKISFLSKVHVFHTNFSKIPINFDVTRGCSKKSQNALLTVIKNFLIFQFWQKIELLRLIDNLIFHQDT